MTDSTEAGPLPTPTGVWEMPPNNVLRNWYEDGGLYLQNCINALARNLLRWERGRHQEEVAGLRSQVERLTEDQADADEVMSRQLVAVAQLQAGIAAERSAREKADALRDHAIEMEARAVRRAEDAEEAREKAERERDEVRFSFIWEALPEDCADDDGRRQMACNQWGPEAADRLFPKQTDGE